MLLRRGVLTAVALAVALTAVVRSDEGMWTFDKAPLARINAALGTAIDQAWLDRIQAGAVRLGGCSASLVSSEGLVLTNQHCVRSCLQSFSTPGRDRVAEGFFTKGRDDERTCPGQTAEVLLSIEDVTARVMAATAGTTGREFVRARSAEQAAIEKAGCGADASLRCQVVTLHRGGQYKLYKYRRYSDVRLVYVPEHQAVVFGGDPDNFNFPRFALDAAFLRVYENGKPASTPSFLRWTPRAPKPGEPVFVAGNPGSTSRLETVAQLETARDVQLPALIKRYSELRGRLLRFADESAEHKRMTRDAIRGVENNVKRLWGQHQTLADPAFMDAKRAAERELIARSAGKAGSEPVAGAVAAIAAVQPQRRALMPFYDQLEQFAGASSVLYNYARTLVRAALARSAAAPGDRLPEYSDARLAVLGKSLTEPRAIEPELETLYLGFWLSKAREVMGTDAPETKTLLGRESPEGLAGRLVAGTKLADPAVRKALWDGGEAAVRASDDPLIRFVLATDAQARAVRAAWEERAVAPTDRAAERLALARFEAYGDDVYPDATFTLRLSYGRIEGWKEGDRVVEPVTRIAGLWERATGAEPYVVSPGLAAARDRLAPGTVFTVATTNDIVGGNSGSPLLDAQGNVIGAIFDGNLHSNGGTYGYDPQLNRAVAVSAAVVQEALLKVYDQPHLVKELSGK
ncbi:MAG TPA: S46 family peptidase [Vicinamibacterales bacterium]|nr:S46 family peptidase [Vicinamibacterales bacterium]